ncbi:hypothetical protein [Halolactibacillus sp. JCM 19043]|uniref:beta-sandwich lipoprotein n=1 Tax=Halolactibacillus sp. JCM 19043 TaxID=1460638 RepID=UPI0007841B11|nr:hypothetical protein [Halolactibacillus sp. JCM 19043]
MKQRKLILLTMVLLTILLSACSAADTVSHNISKDSDEFRVIRRVVFYNSLTDTYIMEMVGNISVDIDRDNVIEVIAKVGPDKYQKHYLGLSDNVTYTVEQLGTSDVSEYDYKMIFKPEKIIPIDFEYKKGEEQCKEW